MFHVERCILARELRIMTQEAVLEIFCPWTSPEYEAEMALDSQERWEEFERSSWMDEMPGDEIVIDDEYASHYREAIEEETRDSQARRAALDDNTQQAWEDSWQHEVEYPDHHLEEIDLLDAMML